MARKHNALLEWARSQQLHLPQEFTSLLAQRRYALATRWHSQKMREYHLKNSRLCVADFNLI